MSVVPGSIHDWRTLTGTAAPIHNDKHLKLVLHAGGLVIPIYRLGDPTPYTWVLRPDLPRSDTSGKPIKYEWPHAVAPVFDVLPRYAQALGDPNVPLWLTEGAKKADSLATAYDRAIVPVNLNGVYGWRGTNAQGGKTALADFELIAWEGRRVVIAPDGDVRHNKGVQGAVNRLARLLLARYGVAEVLVLHLPNAANGSKLGVDDFLAQGHDTQTLETHLTTVGAVAASACIQIGRAHV